MAIYHLLVKGPRRNLHDFAWAIGSPTRPVDSGKLASLLGTGWNLKGSLDAAALRVKGRDLSYSFEAEVSPDLVPGSGWAQSLSTRFADLRLEITCIEAWPDLGASACWQTGSLAGGAWACRHDDVYCRTFQKDRGGPKDQALLAKILRRRAQAGSFPDWRAGLARATEVRQGKRTARS